MNDVGDIFAQFRGFETTCSYLMLVCPTAANSPVLSPPAWLEDFVRKP